MTVCLFWCVGIGYMKYLKNKSWGKNTFNRLRNILNESFKKYKYDYKGILRMYVVRTWSNVPNSPDRFKRFFKKSACILPYVEDVNIYHPRPQDLIFLVFFKYDDRAQKQVSLPPILGHRLLQRRDSVKPHKAYSLTVKRTAPQSRGCQYLSLFFIKLPL